MMKRMVNRGYKEDTKKLQAGATRKNSSMTEAITAAIVY